MWCVRVRLRVWALCARHAVRLFDEVVWDLLRPKRRFNDSCPLPCERANCFTRFDHTEMITSTKPYTSLPFRRLPGWCRRFSHASPWSLLCCCCTSALDSGSESSLFQSIGEGHTHALSRTHTHTRSLSHTHTCAHSHHSPVPTNSRAFSVQVVWLVSTVLACVALVSSLLLLYFCLDSGSESSLFQSIGLPAMPYGNIITAIYLKVLFFFVCVCVYLCEEKSGRVVFLSRFSLLSMACGCASVRNL